VSASRRQEGGPGYRTPGMNPWLPSAFVVLSSCTLLHARYASVAQPWADVNKDQTVAAATYIYDLNLNSRHDPGEPQGDVLPWTSQRLQVEDNSCWLASAANMASTQGCDANALYASWTTNGLLNSKTGSWLTIDDRGYQDIALRYEGFDLSVHDNQTLPPGPDEVADWLDADRVCGVGIYFLFSAHALTLWGIDTQQNLLWYTDSDDSFVGAQQASYAWSESRGWKFASGDYSASIIGYWCTIVPEPSTIALLGIPLAFQLTRCVVRRSVGRRIER
jgi:hypothetical protein